MSLPAKPLEYRGDLSETTLPEMLYTIDRFQVPGVIEARRNGVVKRVYLKSGYVTHATSTDLRDSLGGFLERTGRLTREQSTEMMQLRRNSTQRLGVLLIEQGLLAPAEVYQAIRQQIEAVVWSLFAWQDGEITFSIGEHHDPGMVKIELPMRQVILEGIKRTAEAKLLVKRLGSKDAVFAADYHVESLIEMALSADDLALLRRVDGRRSLYEIASDGPYPLQDNAKLMYAFYVMKLIRKVDATEKKPDDAGAPIKIRFKTRQP